MTTVTKMERRERPGLMAGLYLPVEATPAVSGLYAEVKAGDATIEVSRLDGEDGWTVDAVWTKGSFPVFSNGFGARYLRTHAPAADIAALLTAHAALVYVDA